MEALLQQARDALASKNGREALQLADRLLDADEGCVEAWLIAMRSFQFIFPVDRYDPKNEITCGEGAIDAAPPEEKDRVAGQVYAFYLSKILAVLRHDARVLADGKDLLTFYQARVYTSASLATALTREKDQPLVDAVFHSLDYCKALFEAVPVQALNGNPRLNARAREAAVQWRKTYSYLEMRFELYRSNLSRRQVEEGIRQYARFLRTVADREQLLASPLPFNHIHRLDQSAFLDL